MHGLKNAARNLSPTPNVVFLSLAACLFWVVPGEAVYITQPPLAGVNILADKYYLLYEDGGDSAGYDVVLNSPPAYDVIITAACDQQLDLGNGPAQPLVLTFTAQNWNIPQHVVMTAVDDDLIEGYHYGFISHTAGSEDPAYDGIDILGIYVDIIDNDYGTIQITETGEFTEVAEEGPTSDTYSVALTYPPTWEVNVFAECDEQVDLGAGPGKSIMLQFTPEDWYMPQTITVTAVDDALPEGPHSSLIAHHATSEDPAYDGIAIDPVYVDIVDNDYGSVIVEVSGPSTIVTEKVPTCDTYTVVLGAMPRYDVNVFAHCDQQLDLGAGPGQTIMRTFTPRNWNVPQEIKATAVDDAVPEGDHWSLITHSTTSEDPAYDSIAVADVPVQIIDDDIPQITIRQSDGYTQVHEAGPTSDIYDVQLNWPPTAPVTVTAQCNNQIDLGNGPGMPVELTFDPKSWQSPQTVTVTAVDDPVIEGDHQAIITHTVASEDYYYGYMSMPDVTVNIVDNDFAGVVIEQDEANVVSETGPTSGSYTVQLASQPTATVLVTVQCDSQLDLGAGAGQPVDLTFTPQDWNQPQTVTCTAVDDAIYEGTHYSTITHRVASADPYYDQIIPDPEAVDVQIQDNDYPAVTISESDETTEVAEQGPTSDNYTIVLSSQPLENVQIIIEYDGQGGSTPARAAAAKVADSANAFPQVDLGAGPGRPHRGSAHLRAGAPRRQQRRDVRRHRRPNGPRAYHRQRQRRRIYRRIRRLHESGRTVGGAGHGLVHACADRSTDRRCNHYRPGRRSGRSGRRHG